MLCSTKNIPSDGPPGEAAPEPARSAYRELPVVAIVGRPNVGKSTLFNRIVRGRIAIVDDEPGVTRDRNYRESHWSGKRFFVVDTGGLVPGSEDTIETLIRKQVEVAIEEAAVIVFVVDAASGMTPLDRDIAQLIRETRKPHVLAANKADARRAQEQISEVYELGLGDFIAVSAEHGTGVGDLLDAIAGELPTVGAGDEHVAAIAVVGKPNVGKSSLVNRLTGTEAVIVDDQPGTTRDSIDTFIETSHGRVRLVDTAGLRRKARADTDLEKYANLRSVGAIDRSDIAVLMLDAQSGLAKQDLTIASYIERAGKGIVIAWNKWDLHKEEDRPVYLERTRGRFRHMTYAPIVFISCKTGDGIDLLTETCFKVHTEWDTRIPTAVLNRSLVPVLERKPPSGRGKKRFPKVYYVAQTGSKPPAFTLFVNDPAFFGDNYRKFIERQLRSLYSFEGCPIRVRIRKSK